MIGGSRVIPESPSRKKFRARLGLKVTQLTQKLPPRIRRPEPLHIASGPFCTDYAIPRFIIMLNVNAVFSAEEMALVEEATARAGTA